MAKAQDIIYEIIRNSRQLGLGYITKTQIIEEAKKTSLGEQNEKNYSGTKTKLQTQVDQALYQLHSKGKIKKKGHGKWTVDKYTPREQIICKHIKKQNDKWWCPVRKTFIGNPKEQCNVLFGSDIKKPIKKHGDAIVQIPRCVGFTDRKSTLDTIKIAKEAIAVQDAREQRNKRKRGDIANQGLI